MEVTDVTVFISFIFYCDNKVISIIFSYTYFSYFKLYIFRFYVMVYRVNKVPNKLDFVVVCTTLVYSSLFISVLLFCSVGFWLVQYSR